MHLKNNIGLLFLLVPCLLVSCADSRLNHMAQPKQQNDQLLVKSIYRLDQSTDIIIDLIKSGEFSDMLAGDNKKDVDVILKNFSPSEMAFEAEVLNSPKPVVVLFYDNESSIETLEKFAEQHKEIKCVAINAEKLFKVTEHSEVDRIPTFILINKRQEIGRIERDASIDELQNLVCKCKN